MRKLISFLCAISAVLTVSAQPKPHNGDMFLADPFIYCENGSYYIYGTGARDGIAVYRSEDMRSWYGPCGKAQNSLALYKDDVWGENKFWAPEVYRMGEKYYMTLSASEHIILAESDSPLGPFVQGNKQPYLDERGIDSHIFIDTDGTPYIFWVRFDGGNVIFQAPLSRNLQNIDMSHCRRDITSEAGTWERTESMPKARVAEGPFVIHSGDTYFLTYSCNHFQSPDYAVGYATSKSIEGPWIRAEENPILRNHGGYKGTGHHAIFRDSNGDYFIVYHAHNSAEKVGPRRTLISPLKISGDNGKMVMSVGDEIIVPQIVNK